MKVERRPGDVPRLEACPKPPRPCSAERSTKLEDMCRDGWTGSRPIQRDIGNP